jgi:DNA-binding transcriptional regulator GbsR (MarR family)
MQVTDLSYRFIMHWGEMGTRWGVNRTVSQIHALLFLSDEPLPAEEIADALGVARSNVSNSLKELQNWNLVRVVHTMGDRRDLFATSKDPWELFRTITRERKAREFDPTLNALESFSRDPNFGNESPTVQRRIGETLSLMTTVSKFTDDMLKLPSPTLTKLMKLGSKLQAVLPGERNRE